MKPFKVGLDSYCLKPLALEPVSVLEWAKKHGAEGVQFSEGAAAEKVDKGILKALAQYAQENKLYLEWGGGQHIPLNPLTGQRCDIVPINRKAAEQAGLLGARIVRSCSGGLMRWHEDSVPTDALVLEMAKSLKAQKDMLKDLGVVLAIETHFEFTTFELARVFEIADIAPGESVGICLDTMNLLTMLEDPVAATRRILPWVVATHIKDGVLIPFAEGLVSFPVEVGKGLVDLAEIIGLLSTAGHEVNLTLEDHGGSFEIPIFDERFLARFPDLTQEELGRLLVLAEKGQRLVDGGEVVVLDRSRWAEVYEKRVREDLKAIKALAGKAR